MFGTWLSVFGHGSGRGGISKMASPAKKVNPDGPGIDFKTHAPTVMNGAGRLQWLPHSAWSPASRRRHVLKMKTNTLNRINAGRLGSAIKPTAARRLAEGIKALATPNQMVNRVNSKASRRDADWRRSRRSRSPCLTPIRLKTVSVTFGAGRLITASPAFAQNDTNRFHAPVLAERGDQHEAFVVAALEWLKGTAAKDHFAIDVFENPNQSNKAFLARYQVIIQLNYPPYRWSDEAKAAFQDYIEQGRGGWVGLHHATLLGELRRALPMWPLVLRFHGRDSVSKLILPSGSQARWWLRTPSHPCLKGLSGTFVVGEEEWYNV